MPNKDIFTQLTHSYHHPQQKKWERLQLGRRHMLGQTDDQQEGEDYEE